jgi:hypothetical protein
MMVLSLHIISGLLGLISGFIAVFSVKGMKLHRRSGMVFVYSMLTLAATGTVLGLVKNELSNATSGALTFYLVATALLTVRDRERKHYWIDAAATLVALTVGILNIQMGIDALNSPSGTRNGVPAGMILFLGSIALMGALGDIRVRITGELHGTHRIARHLWRMCFALFVASGSFFLGQAQVFPKPIRIFPLLAIPALLPLVLMIYWLARVLFTKWYRRRADSFRRPTEVGGVVSV